MGLCNVVSSQMLRQELVCGNWFQLLGTALGWCVTPLYKRFADPDLHSHNVLYDLLAPLLRGWFVELSHQVEHMNRNLVQHFVPDSFMLLSQLYWILPELQIYKLLTILYV